MEALRKAVIKNVDEVPITLENIAEVKTGAKAPKMGLASDAVKAVYVDCHQATQHKYP